MAKFLLTVWPLSGHCFPMLAVAHGLRRRGHDVAIYTGAGFSELIEQEGFRCFPFQSLDESLFQEFSEFRTHYTTWKRPFRLLTLLRRWLVDTIPGQVSDIRDIAKTWKPDAIVSETTMWGPMVVLHEADRIPVAVFSTVIACLLPGPDASPGRGMPKPQNARTRASVRIFGYFKNVFGRKLQRPVNVLRRAYDLPPIATNVTAFTGTMPLYLVPSIPDLDFHRRDLPPSVQYVGPCIWNKPTAHAPPKWLEELPQNIPWVHVTEGTLTTQDPIFLPAAAAGLANLPIQVIMTTGEGRPPEELNLSPTAPNIKVVPWVAHNDILHHTRVVVTTGGAGTIMTMLQQGIPLVIIPTEWDKPENSLRVVEAGVGLRLQPKEVTPDKLRVTVERVLHESTFRENAERIAAELKRYGGPDQAAELLERMVSDRTAAPSTPHVQDTTS